MCFVAHALLTEGFLRLHTRRRMPLPLRPRMMSESSNFLQLKPGQVVLAEVQDLEGSLSNPQAVFSIKGMEGASKNSDLTARMNVGALRPNEKLALQAGAVMKVVVTQVDGSGVWVALDRNNYGNDNSNINAPLSPRKAAPSAPASSAAAEKKMKKDAKSASSSASVRSSSSQPFVTKAVPDLLLSKLKTGMRLKGVVTASTHYAAFCDVGVFRPSRGGLFTQVNGMLHANDLGSVKKSDLVVGQELDVYVREVYKNSGRFSLTLDPTISKAKVIAAKTALRQEGNARRRARRVRRILDAVTPGQTVTGVVDRVVPAGVLVTISSLGPLNVTGLLGKRDLPAQFEVPPDLKESFQAQLLQQDFMPGRAITCGVLKVNPRSNARMTYNLKLLFEELGPVVEREEVVSENALTGDGGDDIFDDEDDDEDGESEDAKAFEEVSGDVREIYNELRGASPLLAVADLLAWGDLQDMVANGAIQEEDIQRAIRAAGAKSAPGAFITLEQLDEIVEYLQVK